MRVARIKENLNNNKASDKKLYLKMGKYIEAEI